MYVNIVCIFRYMPFNFKCLLVKMHMNLKSVIVIWLGTRVLSYSYEYTSTHLL